jgi:hypothetical protein
MRGNARTVRQRDEATREGNHEDVVAAYDLLFAYRVADPATIPVTKGIDACHSSRAVRMEARWSFPLTSSSLTARLIEVERRASRGEVQ